MRKNEFFTKVALVVFLALRFSIIDMMGQCEGFEVLHLRTDCHNAGTIGNPLDDTFIAKLYIGNNPDTTTWSSSDSSYINQTYSASFFDFGPYLISGGNVTIVIKDDQSGCDTTIVLAAPAPCSDPPITCPDFDLCYQMISRTNCSATFAVTLDGDLASHDNIGSIFLSWSATGGVIESIIFDTTGTNYLQSGGVTISGNSASGGSGINGFDIVNNTPHFLITISTGPGSCVQLDDGLIGIIIGDTPCLSAERYCENPVQFCATGVEVAGKVTAPGQIYDCPDTKNHGIEGAEISIMSPGGESCHTTTSNKGVYSCLFCDQGPYIICVDTQCDEPCGVTDYDLVLFRDYILGRRAWTKEMWLIGDVNGSGTASTLDLVLIQRQLLGLDSTTIQNWCKFIPVADLGQLPAPSYQNDSIYAAVDHCITVSDPWTSRDFVRLMLGDFDGSCTDCVHGDKLGDLPIVIDNDSRNYRSSIKSTIHDKIHALTLHIPIPSGMEVLRVNSALPGYEYAVKGGEVHFIWLDLSEDNAGYEVAIDQVLVEIEADISPLLHLAPQENYWLSASDGIKKIVNDVEFRSKTHDKAKQILSVNDRWSLEIQSVTGEGNLYISDTYGRMMSTKKINSSTHKIDVDLPLGVYIFYIKDERGIQSHKLFISK